jgi:hypothetical protein
MLFSICFCPPFLSRHTVPSQLSRKKGLELGINIALSPMIRCLAWDCLAWRTGLFRVEVCTLGETAARSPNRLIHSTNRHITGMHCEDNTKDVILFI